MSAAPAEVSAIAGGKPGLSLDEAHQHLGPEPGLMHEDGKGILASSANARIPLTETAHVLHGGLRRSVHLALLLLIRRQQENEDDEPKDGSNEKH